MSTATPRLQGYAAVFNSPTVIAGLFREQIAPGAFADAVKRDDVRALFNHNPHFVLGRTKAGTLRLQEDCKGLAHDVTPPDAQWARDLMVSVKRGDISQSSFAFEVTDEQWDYGTRGELPLRTIRAARLNDVSPVTFPAYDDTSVLARHSATRGVIEMREQATAYGSHGSKRDFEAVQKLQGFMRDGEGVPCDRGCGRRSKTIRILKGSGGSKLFCAQCNTDGDALAPAGSFNREQWARLGAASAALPVAPDVQRSRQRLAAAERGERVTTPTRPKTPARVVQNPAGRAWPGPVQYPTRWSEIPD